MPSFVCLQTSVLFQTYKESIVLFWEDHCQVFICAGLVSFSPWVMHCYVLWVCNCARNEQISTLYQINYLFWLDNFRVLGRFLYSCSLNSANQNTVFKFNVFWLDDFRVLGRFVYSYSLNSAPVACPWSVVHSGYSGFFHH
jgi:hypothetical protein